MRLIAVCVALFLALAPALAGDLPDAAAASQRFRQWMAANHVPGLVWGVVQNGRLIHVEALGVTDPHSRQPVTTETRFRIASMSKAFTARAILALADQGRLRLDDKAARHVPQLVGWGDDIHIRDLLYHTAGFVTDDPWGDRQQPLPEADFTALLAAGVPLQRPPGTAYEYSNLGYAILGRVITNVTGHNFADEITATIFAPLGMAATSYDIAKTVPGWRWVDDHWQAEPAMAAGAFGAMGGVVTTAGDYARWLAWLLEDGLLQRQIRAGSGFLHPRTRPGADGPGSDGNNCRRQNYVYAAGLVAGRDCVLGRLWFHSGGYPGYGSHMLLLPDSGVALFAFANRTYAAPAAPLWEVAGALTRAGVIAGRAIPVSAALTEGYEAVRRIWTAGDLAAGEPHLAANMWQDASRQQWVETLAAFAAVSGPCDTSAAIRPDGALSGTFRWRCRTGQLHGQILMAPTPGPQIQALRLSLPPR